MEPRPPRPRSPRQFETPGAPPAPGIGDRLYPAAGELAPSAAPEGYASSMAAEPPLLPRQQRRQRRAVRGVLGTVALIGLIAVLGWLFRDAILGLVSPPPPSPTAIAQSANESEANLAVAGTPSSAPASAGLPNALATVTPTVGAPTATPRPQPTEAAGEPESSTQDQDISAQTQPLLAFLPTQDQAPAGLALTAEAERSKADVVESLGGSDEAAQLLDDWGWSGNAFREFTAAEADVAPGGINYLNVSVHRFADADSAANALVFFSDQVIFGQGLQEVEAPAIGDSARLLVGPPVAVLYVQDGPILYRLGGSSASPEGDPTSDLLSVAAAIIPGRADGAG